METYTGSIKQVRFYSEETKFIVALVEIEELDQTMMVTGYMSSYNDVDRYRFYGDFVIHPKYGKQFKFSRYDIAPIEKSSEIIRYLSSPLFKGIGTVQATAIVETLGEDALEKIRQDKSVLDCVKGMSYKKRDMIFDVLTTSSYDQHVMQFFLGHGVSAKMIAKITATYQEHALDIVSENPYQMIEDIDGIGFKMADDLALQLGFDMIHPYRLEAAIVFSLKNVCFQQGGTYCDKETLYHMTYRIVQIVPETFEIHYQHLIETGKIVEEEQRIYDKTLYEGENFIASTLKMYQGPSFDIDRVQDVEAMIESLEKEEGIIYAQEQREAIMRFLDHQLMILTGGPGTGKTTIVRAIIKVYQKLQPHQSIALVAPTGRASKRLYELTGVEACTIHRLLKWDLHSNTFGVNEKNPLSESLVIIDEFSMVDTFLLYHLLKASSHVKRFLFIGDDQQLPSVGPGMILKDLLSSKLFESVKLKKIFRQKEDSGIIQFAHHIREDHVEEALEDIQGYPDLLFYPCRNYEVKDLVASIVLKLKDMALSLTDFQVLAPMYDGVAGIDALNDILQSTLNPASEDKLELRLGKKVFREGDKILQLKNRVDDNVFNGDIGILVEVIKKDNFNYLHDTLVVDFDGNFVEYQPNDFNTITHAYCMSIHKAQGSEFQYVIMPILYDYSVMLRKNLIYTGASRAKKQLILLGNAEALTSGILKNQDVSRKTTLPLYLGKNDQEATLSVYDFM